MIITILTIKIKGDVSGSLEAIEEQIKAFPRDQLNVFLVRKGIGPISEADVKIATSTANKCIILGNYLPLLK